MKKIYQKGSSHGLPERGRVFGGVARSAARAGDQDPDLKRALSMTRK